MLIRLKELRLKRGYSMLQAARKIFSHLDTYNRYEKGIREIPLDSLMLLARRTTAVSITSQVFPTSRENMENNARNRTASEKIRLQAA